LTVYVEDPAVNPKINELISRIRELEEEIEAELERRREEFHFRIENRGIRFEHEMLARHRRLKIGLLRYVSHASLPSLVSAPIIYSLIVPLALADLAVTIYQTLCFPLYGIPRVVRGKYLHFDRGNLGYLNLLERLNCAYCAYANGVAAYIKQVAGRTELYWCPIKHARRVLAAHDYYRQFADFGDAEAYKREIASQRGKPAQQTAPISGPD
jgi:hypothetical protein